MAGGPSELPEDDIPPDASPDAGESVSTPAAPDIGSAVARLSKFTEQQYEIIRRAEAKALGIRASALDKMVDRNRPRRPLTDLEKSLQEGDFIMGKDGPSPIYTNVVELLKINADTWNLRYDEFAMRSALGDEYLEDHHLRAIAEWVQRNGVHASTRTIAEGAIRMSEAVRFHPVKDYLESLVWDEIGRIDHILIDHAGAEDTPLNRAVTARWLMQAVARIYEPGCQADAMLVLEGDQGLGKSTFFRELFGDKWFTDHLPDITSKDALVQLRGVWCVEISELAQFGRVDTARIKAFITSRIDRYRDPYGRLVADFPRGCVFSGTVNPGAHGFLKDATGGRRFWFIEVTENIDVAAVRKNRDQIWAEAVYRYLKGEQWYLETEDLKTSAKESQAERFEDDPWDDAIAAYVANLSETSTTDILQNAIGLQSKGEWGKPEQMRVGTWLSHNGWVKKKKRHKGEKPKNRFVRRVQKTVTEIEPFPPEVGTSTENDEVGTDDKLL